MLLVCIGIHNHRNLAPEKGIESYQASRCLAIGTHPVLMVVSVVAKVGNNEGQVGCAINCLEIALELIQGYVVRFAIFIVDGMKVDERIVLGRVLTIASRSLVGVGLAQHGMLASSFHIFHITSP